jgi:hypothetical protein
MADVFELPPRHLARPRRQIRRQPFERLHAGQLVGTQRVLASRVTFTSTAIDRAHVSDLRVALGVRGWGKPGSDAVRLQVGCFSTTATHGAERCGR